MPDHFLLVTIITILFATFIFIIGLLLAHVSLRKVMPDASFSVRKYTLLFLVATFTYALLMNEVPYLSVVAAIVLPLLMIIVLWSIFVYRHFFAK